VTTRKSIHLAGLQHKVPIPNGAKVGNLFFSSAINGKDRETGRYPDESSDEFRVAFDNMAALVREAGGDIGDIGLLTVFLRDRGDKKLVDEQWIAMFPDADDRPARHVVDARADGPMRVQLQVIAVVGDGGPL
jgi:2-iminobutanoate/2-iminopropanoate deaminase